MKLVVGSGTLLALKISREDHEKKRGLVFFGLGGEKKKEECLKKENLLINSLDYSYVNSTLLVANLPI